MSKRNEPIVDRVVQRLQAQPLGDLITEEDLHDVVKEAIPRVFFEERITPSKNTYGSPERREPAIYEVMRDVLRENAKKAVEAWAVENAEKMHDYWMKVTDAGLLKYVEQIQNDNATAGVKKALQGWVEHVNQQRGQQGMPPLPYFL